MSSTIVIIQFNKSSAVNKNTILTLIVGISTKSSRSWYWSRTCSPSATTRRKSSSRNISRPPLSSSPTPISWIFRRSYARPPRNTIKRRWRTSSRPFTIRARPKIEVWASSSRCRWREIRILRKEGWGGFRRGAKKTATKIRMGCNLEWARARPRPWSIRISPQIRWTTCSTSRENFKRSRKS